MMLHTAWHIKVATNIKGHTYIPKILNWVEVWTLWWLFSLNRSVTIETDESRY